MVDGTRTTDLPSVGILDEVLGNYQGAAGRAAIAAVAAQIKAVNGPETSVLVVESKSLSTPPGSPTTGAVYIPATGASGAWSGHVNDLATWTGSSWSFQAPSRGFTALIVNEGTFYFWDSGASKWVQSAGDSLLFETWSALSAVTGTKVGQKAVVPASDAGTHTDPVAGGTVDNAGSYRWSASPAGWRWITADDFSLKADIDSPVFTGNPQAPEPATGNKSASLATTQFVQNETGAKYETVSNDLTNSEAFNTWTVSRTTVTADATTAPDGTTTADKVGETSETGAHSIFKNHAALAAGTSVCWSIYLKAAERSRCWVQAANSSVLYRVVADLDTKTVYQDSGAVYVRAFIEDAGDGWYRIGMYFRIFDGAAATTCAVLFLNGASVSYAGTVGSGMYLWGSQFDFAPDIRPYVPAGGSVASAAKKILAHDYGYHGGASVGFGAVDDPNILYIVGQGGQSNGAGSGVDAPVATTPVYADYALSGPNGPHSDGTRFTEFSDLIETSLDLYNETAMSGWVNSMIAAIETEMTKRPRFAAINYSVGAAPYEQLKRGAKVTGVVNQYRRSYENFLSALWDMTAIAKANGWRPVFIANDWFGNESNIIDPADIWAAKMIQNYRMMDEDIRRITGQKENWIYFITSCRYVGGIADFSAFGPTMLEGNQIAMQRHPYIKIAQPTYHLDTIDGNVHVSSVGQNKRGQELARAALAELFYAGWSPFIGRKAYRTGATEITVDFDGSMSGSLVMDTSNAVVTSTGFPTGNYYGFRFDDQSGSSPYITGHSIVSVRRIKLTLSAAPSADHAWRLSYATERNPGVTTDGPGTGARGCLRKSTAYTLTYDMGTSYDWCNPFMLDVAK
jgi:hypothetical protein